MGGKKGADVEDMLAKMNGIATMRAMKSKKVMKSKEGKKSKKHEDIDETDDAQSDAETSEAPAKQKVHLGNPKAKAKGGAKAQAAKQGKKKAKKVFDDKTVLAYAGVKVHEPRRFGKSTIYTSIADQKWRLKPEPGSRKETQFPFTDEPEKQWKLLVKKLKELNR